MTRSGAPLILLKWQSHGVLLTYPQLWDRIIADISAP